MVLNTCGRISVAVIISGICILFAVQVTVYGYTDPTLVGKEINAVMKVHSPDGSVIKTTSFPLGFIANSTGIAELLTNIPKSAAQNITTETVFTDLNKTNVLSNTIQTPPHIDKFIKSSDITPTVIANSS